MAVLGHDVMYVNGHNLLWSFSDTTFLLLWPLSYMTSCKFFFLFFEKKLWPFSFTIVNRMSFHCVNTVHQVSHNAGDRMLTKVKAHKIEMIFRGFEDTPYINSSFLLSSRNFHNFIGWQKNSQAFIINNIQKWSFITGEKFCISEDIPRAQHVRFLESLKTLFLI